MAYSRDNDLSKNFNKFFDKFGVKDLYSKLSGRDLIELKKLLSCINNIITLRTTRDFVEKLYADGFLTKSEREKFAKKVVRISENGEEKEYEAVNATKEDGFHPSCVSNCCNGIRGKHKGYRWKFADEGVG